MGFQKFKSFLQVGLGRIIPAGIQSLFYLIFAFFLEPSQYGNLSYLISIAAVTSVISRAGLPFSITVFAAKEKSSLVNQIAVLSFFLSCIASVILIFIQVEAALLAFSLTTFTMNQQLLLGKKQYKDFLVNGIIRSVLLIGLTILLYWIFDLAGILVGMAISNIVSSVFYFKTLKIMKIEKFRSIKTNMTSILHNFGTESSNFLPRYIDKLIIVPFFGLASTGIYQLNLQILFVMELFPMALHSFLLPEESSGKTYKRMITYVVIISSLLSLVAILLAPIFISTFFPKYFSGIESLQVLLLALIPLSISSVLNARLQALESNTIGYSVLIRIGSLLALIVILGNMWEILGMSMAVLFSIMINTGFLALMYRRHLKKK